MTFAMNRDDAVAAKAAAEAAARRVSERETRRSLERRRHLRRFRRCEPVDHARPWEKYANRGRPSSIEGHVPGAVNRLWALFDPKARAIIRAFGGPMT